MEAVMVEDDDEEEQIDRHIDSFVFSSQEFMNRFQDIFKNKYLYSDLDESQRSQRNLTKARCFALLNNIEASQVPYPDEEHDMTHAISPRSANKSDRHVSKQPNMEFQMKQDIQPS